MDWDDWVMHHRHTFYAVKLEEWGFLFRQQLIPLVGATSFH